MNARSYPFIDIAVHDLVRTRFAAGDALVVLPPSLDRVIWANGPGARLLGFDGFEDALAAQDVLSPVARRQIAATRGFPALGEDRPVAVRIVRADRSELVAFFASEIGLPGGESAILLAAALVQEDRIPGDIAALAIGGLSAEGQEVALVDAAGLPAAASPGFAEMGVPEGEFAALLAYASRAHDRLVKRMIATRNGKAAVGVARLLDEPASYLVMVVAAPQEEDLAETQETETQLLPAMAESSSAASGIEQADTRPVSDSAPTLPDDEKPAGSDAAPAVQPHDDWYFSEAAPGSAEAADGRELPQVPVRFVWRTDAEGRFSHIGEEFASVVGPAADVVGLHFRDVADRLGLEKGGEIADLLHRRDTWSGRAVLWPVSGAGLRVPVDLAALPVYDRDRNFEGFRGFGVARFGEMTPDTDAAREPPREQDLPADEAEDAEDPFHGEPPALELTTGPERRTADKVIRLAERRPPVSERALSSTERLNFREIGQRLRESGIAAMAATDGDATLPIDESADRTVPPLAEQPSPPSAEALDPAEDVGEQVPFHDEARVTAESGAEPIAIGEAAFLLQRDLWDPEPATAENPAPRSAGDEAVAVSVREDLPANDQVAPTAVEAVEAVEENAVAPQAGSEPASSSDDRAPAAAAEPAADRPTANVAEAAPAQPMQAAAGVFLPSAFAGQSEEPLPGADIRLLSRLPLPLLVHAGDVLHYANREFLDLTGYASLAALGEAGGIDALFAEPVAESAVGPGRLPLRRADGSVLPVEAHLQSVAWNKGKALMLVLRPDEPAAAAPDEPVPAIAPTHDETELLARLEELRTIIDTATDGVVIVDNDGTVRSISQAAEALFGLADDDIAGRPFETLFAMESQRAARDYLAGLSENGVASVLNDGREVIGREAQGRFIPLFMTMGRLPGAGGYCAVMRDITQWKRAEEQLTQARSQAERASSQKTDFLARVSHEIRTPLNAIIGFSELMIDERFGPVSNERYRGYLRDINKSGNHVLDLVNDLLDISKIEAGEQEMSYEAVSLNDTLGEAVAMMQPQANRERVIIRSSLTSRLPDVVADLRSIRQIALNLLSNAIRYTPAGGQVIVSTSYEPSGDIVIRVRDTGIGMSSAELDQALKPFKQVNALKRPRGDGTGLGLPLTKAMVEANRARFVIHSTPGEGTLVEIVFPSTRVLAH